MNSNGNLPFGSRMKEPTIVRRATLAGCRSRSNAPLSTHATNLSSRKTTTVTTVGQSKRPNPAKTTDTTKPVQRGVKRQISRTENSAPAAKLCKQESGRNATKKVGSKRAGWDYKGRLEDMEEYVRSMSHSQKENRNRLELLESTNSKLEGNVVTKEKKIEEASGLNKDLQTHVNSLLQNKTEMEQRYQLELNTQHDEKEAIERENNELKFSLEITRNENKTMQLKISEMATKSLIMTTDLEATKDAFTKANGETIRQAQLIDTLKRTIETHLGTIANCEDKLREEESVRRALHNTIQELKGNIRVFCRVRPRLKTEQDEPLTNIDFQDETNMVLCQQNGSESVCGGKRSAAKFPFTFDKIFSPNSTQHVVFGEISQLVQSVLDGYNVCIFAYGQTGSGKTFTMEGDLGAKDAWGMIPRALEQVFFTCGNLKCKGWQYEMEASFLEIYNEAIRDLLGSGDAKTKHEIKLVNSSNGKANDVIVTNLRTVAVTSLDEVSDLLHKAYESRAVAATNCNERSSRSHSVFRLKMRGVNNITEERCEGTLNLVDLAGSERLSQSGSTGVRLKETQNINKSLSNLGIVISALANKEPHIPYRNSKLTYLLQNSLGGNSKSLMFVNISPREDSFQETLSSLRFATQVNTCNIGTAQKVKKV